MDLWSESVLTSFQNKTIFAIGRCRGQEGTLNLTFSLDLWPSVSSICPVDSSAPLVQLESITCLQTRPVSTSQADRQTDRQALVCKDQRVKMQR